ncbi:MAG TPA: HEAT repeat domain-containing protein [Thermoanaerobaculia bacterium]|nr:HEAT repeat domain-containing protein [Thermoanaerobaculia bacterium]
MRLHTLVVCLLLAVTSSAQNFQNATVKSTDAARGVGATVASLSRSGATWFAWRVPVKGTSICCGWQNRSGCCGGCSLDGNHGYSINNDDDFPTTTELLLVLRVEEGRVRKTRLFNPDCPVDGQGKSIQVLTNVTPEASINYLLGQIRNADKEGELLSALSMHEHPRVVPELLQLARHDPEIEVRRHAIFWLGQKAGSKVAGDLRRAVDEDPADEVRQHAVFAISQLPKERSVPMLIELVKTHKSRKIRERALFWLAQTGDQRAVDLIEEILR